MARIIVTVQAGNFPSPNDRSMIFLLDEYLTREASEPLDFPEKDADLATRMICTRPDVISLTVDARHRLAEEVSRTLTRAIVDMLSSGDTENGYAKVSMPVRN